MIWLFHKKSSPHPTENIAADDDASHADFQIRTVFLLGQTENNETQDRITNESRLHNDLIQESFSDSYNNLTLKSVMMVKWINTNCMGKGTFSYESHICFLYKLNVINFSLWKSEFSQISNEMWWWYVCEYPEFDSLFAWWHHSRQQSCAPKL